jgi:hypothetical protein
MSDSAKRPREDGERSRKRFRSVRRTFTASPRRKQPLLSDARLSCCRTELPSGAKGPSTGREFGLAV